MLDFNPTNEKRYIENRAYLEMKTFANAQPDDVKKAMFDEQGEIIPDRMFQCINKRIEQDSVLIREQAKKINKLREINEEQREQFDNRVAELQKFVKFAKL